MPCVVDVALLQMCGAGLDQSANLRKGERFCRLARARGADIALFPEMWNIAYTGCGRGERAARRWASHAVDRKGEFVQHFRRLARELEMAIAITYLERWPGSPRNSVTIFDRRGREILTYAKVHTTVFSFERNCTPGVGFCAEDLDMRGGRFRIGAMICYDREFPESARLLMLKGAELVLVPNACGLDEYRLAQFKTRSYENALALAMTNYAAPQQNGRSLVCDGMAYVKQGARDLCVLQAGKREGIYLARVDLGALRVYRRTAIWGSANRRPECYALLTARPAPVSRSNVRGSPRAARQN